MEWSSGLQPDVISSAKMRHPSCPEAPSSTPDRMPEDESRVFDVDDLLSWALVTSGGR